MIIHNTKMKITKKDNRTDKFAEVQVLEDNQIFMEIKSFIKAA